jgi:hypothetical protein
MLHEGDRSSMPSELSREEFESRMGVLDREVEGEKMVTRHILEQTRRNSDDLAAIKSRLDRHDQRFDVLEQKVDGLERKFDDLTKNLPRIVGDAVREANAGRGRKPRTK